MSKLTLSPAWKALQSHQTEMADVRMRDLFARHPERAQIGARHDCPLLLLQDNAGQSEPGPVGRWKKIWEGNRAGDRSEKFRLYAKEKAMP